MEAGGLCHCILRILSLKHMKSVLFTVIKQILICIPDAKFTYCTKNYSTAAISVHYSVKSCCLWWPEIISTHTNLLNYSISNLWRKETEYQNCFGFSMKSKCQSWNHLENQSKHFDDSMNMLWSGPFFLKSHGHVSHTGFHFSWQWVPMFRLILRAYSSTWNSLV